MIKRLALLLAIGVAGCNNSLSSATVHDGDTITVNGQSIRLNGLDAEELDEPHGVAAREAMKAIVRGGVRCELNGQRSYNRVVGSCFDRNDDDIAALLIQEGLALDCAHFSGGRYRSSEPAGIRAVLKAKRYCNG